MRYNGAYLSTVRSIPTRDHTSQGGMRLNTHGETLNRFLVEVFNEILKTEEQTLTAEWPDLSLREFHLIEEVCRAEDLHRDNRAGAIAAAQRVTAGTLTTAVNLLEKKGYLERRRDNLDRRAVRLYPTAKGRQADEAHIKFHQEMVEDVLSILTEEECQVFLRALSGVTTFFRKKYGGEHHD